MYKIPCSTFIYVGDDYRTPTLSYVRILAGRDTASFYISAVDDRVLEQDETFLIVLDPPSVPDGISNCSAAITIADNDGELHTSCNIAQFKIIVLTTKLSCYVRSYKHTYLLLRFHLYLYIHNQESIIKKRVYNYL